MTASTKAIESWAAAYHSNLKTKVDLRWPAEPLVRMFRGNYIPEADKNYEGKSVLDMGFGNGNNFPVYIALGLRIHGVEVHQSILDLVNNEFRPLGIDLDLRVGTNRNISFADASLDYLVSWNVLHYEQDRSARDAALREYCRVLKPGGRFFISTVGPNNWVLDGAEDCGDGRVRIMRSDDFRKGEIFTRFVDADDVSSTFGGIFANVRIGRIRENLFTAENDAWLVTGVRG